VLLLVWGVDVVVGLKSRKAALSFSERRRCETGSSYGDCSSLQVDLPQSRGLGHTDAASERGDGHTHLCAVAALGNIQFLS